MSAGNLADTVARRAAEAPDALAFITPDGMMTYRALSYAVLALSASLGQRGVAAGQRIGVSMGQSPMHVLALVALARLGAVAVPVHPALTGEQRLAVARRMQVVAVVGELESFKLDGMPFQPITLRELATPPDTEPSFAPDPDSPVRVCFTSGTTGDAKAVMLTHGMIGQRLERATGRWAQGARRFTADLNFISGYTDVWRILGNGGALVFATQGTPEALRHTLQFACVTHAVFSPVQAQHLIPARAASPIFPDLRQLCLIGSAPVPALLDALMTRCTPNVVVTYGSTEAGYTTATPATAGQPDDCGPLVKGAEVEIVGPARELLPVGQTGELRIRCPGMAEGYIGDLEATAGHFRDGWFHPGDLGHLDERGHLFIDGRADDVLSIGGQKVNPHSIEAALRQCPAIVDAAVLVRNGNNGSSLLAAAVVTNVNSPEILVRQALERLGPLCPAAFHRVNGLPRNENGKLLRNKIESLLPNMPAT